MTPGDRPRAIAVLLTCGAASLGAAPDARAQSPEAEVLFREGKKLISAGKLAEGCDKIAASERLESSVGSLLNLGDCREKLGAIASAWAAFRTAEAKAKHAGNDEKRRAEARRRAALLEPRLAYLVVQIERPIEGLVVTRDGAPVIDELWNTAVPVDPGTYELVAAAPGHNPWRTKVTVEPRVRRRAVTVPALEPAPAPPPAPAISAVTAPGAAASAGALSMRAAAGRRPATFTRTRKVSAVFAGAGAAVLGAGAYFGWRSHALAERSDRRCPLVACGDPEGLRLNEEARTAATRANILYAAGGAVAVTAAVLWLAGRPRETRIKPGAAGTLGVTVVGRF
ncbi:MAG TPA: hypothetical protein VNO30_22230 [Kofleriaceae bacterium]|nr:hypothetical protein [Kofleriaceae bacterium]